MVERYDAIVIGGGHNGMVCAGYLAQSGMKVLLAEKSPRLGGPAGDKEFLPGYRTSVTNSPGSLEPRVVRDMELTRFGLEFTRTPATLVHPLEAGDVFVSWRDQKRTKNQFEQFSPGEHTRFTEIHAYLESFARKLGVSLFETPPSLKRLVRNLTDLEDQEAFSRIFFGSARDLFNEFGLSPQTQAILGPLSVVSGQAAPSTPGTPMNLLMRPLSLASSTSEGGHDPRKQPLRGSTGLPIGGMGAVIRALERSLRHHGVVIRTGLSINQALVEEGKASGVVTEAGDVIEAPIVVSATNPRTSIVQFMKDVPEWDPYINKMSNKKMIGKGFKLVLALDTMPSWGAAGSDSQLAEDMASVQFRIAPSIEQLEIAHTDVMLGRIPEDPIVWGLVPTMTSPELAPTGKHLMSLNIGNAPYRIRDSTWSRERDAFARRCITKVAEWVPNLEDSISDVMYLDPTELENEYSLLESNLTHGDSLPWNQFWMRPLPGLHNYRTPTEGYYLSGVGTWPGNFVSGIPGYNASRAVIADLKRLHTSK